MRVALCMECPLHQHGGIEVLVRELVCGLAGRAEVLLVTTDKPEALENSPLRPHIAAHFSWPGGKETSRSDAGVLAEWLASRRADVAHFHGASYLWNARSWKACPIPIVANAGIPCVSTNHGAFSLFECVGLTRPLWFKLATLPLFWPAKIKQLAHVKWEATVSMHDFFAVRRRFFPMASKFKQIYHSKLDGSQPLHPDKKPVVLCLGTVGPRKGQPYLVDAFGSLARQFPEWKLVIAGRHADTKTTRELYAMIERHRLEPACEVLPDVSDELAADLLQTSAIFAFPSLLEGLGLALQEAMFAGAACVGSNVGGIPDLIEDERTGLLVPPASPSSLAAALERLMAETHLREQLATAGRASILEKGMTRQAMIESHLDLYAEALAPG